MFLHHIYESIMILMKDSLKNIDHIIFDYLSNNLREENKSKFEFLLEQSEEIRLYKESIEKMWEGNSNQAKEFNRRFAYFRFKKRVLRDIESEKNKIVSKKKLLFFKTAAAILLLIGSVYLSYIMGVNSTHQGRLVSVNCAAGEKAHVVLPDSSEVWLNSESSISYNTEFVQKTRDVFLSGEAFFHVHANKKNPFNVKAHNMIVTATGTRFNVNAYDDEPVVETSLIEGVVAVSEENNSYKLKPGEVLSINNDTKQWTKSNFVNDDLYIGWKDGKLIFKNEHMSSLVRKFERFYNVEIISEPAVDTIRFSGTLQYESMDELLKILNETQGIIAIKQGKTIYLRQSKKK